MSSSVSLMLLGCLLAPLAHAASDAPLRRNAKALGLSQEASASDSTAAPEPDTDAAGDTSVPADAPPLAASPSSGEGGTRLPGMSGVPVQSNGEDVPLSTGAWVAHGGLTLLPLGGIWAATRVGGDTRLTATASETAAGMLLGSVPARLLFFRPATPGGGRWTELEVTAFGAGLVLTPPLAALGTWGLGELAFGGSRDRGDAYLGALGGAAAGALLGVAVHGVLMKLAEPSARLKAERQLIGLGFIGAGATLGYQWAGGGPRP
ncbi:hypothetical protein [Pyxidicoccus caerfyrddinensis]|uniref:hypothetical protein n=1 Tax=Pyxidicoccus caerfyrddinensis TaxID=2709663 RepID=UPI001F07B4F0|nr:hypothetical protein [Pyxidicoccus caerfyrddinensis]